MTVEQIKEELSNNFVSIIASYLGYKLIKPTDTGGVDFSLTKDTSYVRNGRTRFIQTGQYIDLQLKATTETTVIVNNEIIKYDLEAKTYNDLIFRRGISNAPLYLILFILPEGYKNWIELNNEEILLKKHAYWFIPSKDLLETDNTSRIRISIPLENKLSLGTFDNWFKENYN
jgi:hypothetical protein